MLSRLRQARQARSGKDEQNRKHSVNTSTTVEAKEPALPKPSFFGEEVLPDFDAGKEGEKELNKVPCIWDANMAYSEQVII